MREGRPPATAMAENNRYIVQVYVGALSELYEALSVEASKQTTSEEIVSCIVDRLSLSCDTNYELAEVIGNSFGQECKERRIGASESPVQLMMLWPKVTSDETTCYRFYLREKLNDLWTDNFAMDPQLIKDYFQRFLYQPKDREYPDLCQLPDLNEQTLLDNLRARFTAGHIYTYVGSILIAVNPFKFHPIYNPKYVKLYQNRRLGPNLPPHIFAVADTAYHCMLKNRKNQCIVISGESGSGKTESTNFLLHHLTALSQKGSHGSGVEQTILSAGPVLEAFGNAKTAHNNNSSRFGKFIQVNYKENGMVHGAVVQKYLLEKSRICSQGRNERNYHVFYYLLAGASEQERQQLHLKTVDQYYYLNRSGCYTLDSVDESYEFSRLKQSMEMVGFTAEKQRRSFAVLSAVLLLGNVEFHPRKSAYHHDEAVGVKNPEVVLLISKLLRVKQETLLAALTSKKARVSGEILVINYRLPEAIASRDAMAKCLYGALFDWIVLQVNHALLSKKDTLRNHQGNSIGVLDIFGFEDFGQCNSFEQLCINYANEHLQYYFNQHVFKYEQEEYCKENIRWTNIHFLDNTGCLQLIEGKPNGLLCLLDDQCNFPGATNETLLEKFNSVQGTNEFYEKPPRREAAFLVQHYAGKVKYQGAEMREKNLDLMRQDIVSVLKNSSMAFVRELVGVDPVAVFRWAIVRAFFRAYFAFHEAGRKHRQSRNEGNKTSNLHQRFNRTPNDNIISKQRHPLVTRGFHQGPDKDVPAHNNHSRLPWPTFYNRNRTNVCSNLTSRNATEEEQRARRESTGSAAFQRVLCPDEARVMQRANQIVMKNKSFRPRERSKKGLKNLQTVKTLVGRTGITAGNQGQLGKGRKQPLTVTAQFQQSLHSLMDTLNQANPFFIRCIKSNSNKVPNQFDDETVQRQLRYTGMLETVRIRQAGFNVRLTYDEFIQLYRILLPKGLLSSQADVRHFLATLNLNRDNYQLGSTKIFLRESEKIKLDCKLHQQIMASIVTIQRWFRACLERKRFLRSRNAAVSIQAFWRMCLAQRHVVAMRNKLAAALHIQSVWRGYKTRLWCKKLVAGIVGFQAVVRGRNARKRYAIMKEKAEREKSLVKVQVTISQSPQTFVPIRAPNTVYLEYVRPPSLDKTDLNEESTSVEQLTNKMRTIQTHEPSDETETDSAPISTYITQRKGVELSILDSHSCPTYQDLLSGSNKESRAAGAPSRPEKWESTAYHEVGYSSDNSSLTRSAPPVIEGNVTRFPIYDDTAQAEFYSYSPRSQHRSLTESASIDCRPRKDVFRRSRGNSSDLVSLPPIRRDPRLLAEVTSPRRSEPVMYRVHACSSEESPVESTPEVPVRAVRKPKRAQGEDEAKEKSSSNLLLGTIKEANATLSDTTDNRQVWRPRTDAEEKRRDASMSLDSCCRTIGQHTPVKRQKPIGLPTSLDLRRRNSDPATKTTASLDPTGAEMSPPTKLAPGADLLEWKSSTQFTIAGHRFRKVGRFSKDDRCAYCNREMDAFVTQGHKCADCKRLFHTKCIQNRGVLEMPCEQLQHQRAGGDGKPRRKMRKHSRTHYDLTKQAVTSKFSLTGTSEFTDRTDKIISDARELQLMQDFITNKICKMESSAEGKKPSEVDRVFRQALREFKDNLVATYSVVNKNGYESLNIKYKDLIANFLHVMETVCHQEQKEQDFSVTMGVNAFRGFMNEFMTSRTEADKPSKTKRKKEKKRKVEDPVSFAGHSFILTIINIPTACEICNSFFMWPIERGLVCQACKLTVHKKCYNKVTVDCGKDNASANDSLKVFGASLATLLTDESKVPVVIDRLITTIEMYGLYTEGIYRKSGVSSKVKELKNKMEENRQDEVNFENYQVHVLASVLKSFLREMPEPLLTFDCYDDFIRAANLTDPQDRVATLFDILKKLPQPNFNLMERLIFHLARIALHEDANRMNSAALAIVFAPCILRTNRLVPAQDSLQDITRQTQCIETIISEQLRKVRSTLADIDTLDAACHTVTHRLSSLRSSKVFSPEELLPASRSQEEDSPPPNGEEEESLLVQIHEIKKEKEILTSNLPSLTRATSDDDMLSTDLDGEGSLDDISVAGQPVEVTGAVRRGGARGPVVRSVSGGDPRQPHASKLKRQSSSDVSVAQKGVDDCEDAPIMV